MSNEEVQQVISEKTRLPLGIVASIVIAAITITVFLYRIDARLARIESHIPADWTMADQVAWSLKLKNSNPSLSIPDPTKQP